jgi:hypothetical protein
MLKSFFKQFGPYFIIGTFLTVVFYSTGYNRNWTFWADQELTQAYGALLLNSGLGQGDELLSNPGFISIQLIALLIDLCNYFGFYSIHTITELNNKNTVFEPMRSLVITARYFGLFTMMAFLCGVYALIEGLVKSKKTALLYTLLIFLTNGIFYHLTQTRTELLAYLFLLLSMAFSTKFFLSRDYLSFNYLFLSVLFYFFSLLNKTQVIAFAPIYFISVYFFIKTEPYRSKPRANIWQVIACIISVGFIFFPFARSSNFHSLVLHGISILTLDTIIFIGCRLVSKNPFVSVASFNLFFWACYYLLNFLTQYLNDGNTVFELINNPANMMGLLNTSNGAITPYGDERAGALTTHDPVKLFQFLTWPFASMVLKFNSALIFLAFIGFFYWKNRKLLSKSLVYYGLFCLASFYAITLINGMRGIRPYYLIFSEYFLFIFVFLLLETIKNRAFKNRLIATLSFLVLFINLVPYTDYYNYMIRKGRNSFCGDWPSTIHKQINQTRIDEECEKTPP